MNFDSLDPAQLGAATSNAFAMMAGLVTAYAFSVIGAIIILVIGFWIAKKVKNAVFRLVNRKGETTLAHFLAGVARYAVLTIVLVMVLPLANISTRGWNYRSKYSNPRPAGREAKGTEFSDGPERSSSDTHGVAGWTGHPDEGSRP